MLLMPGKLGRLEDDDELRQQEDVPRSLGSGCFPHNRS